MEGAGRLHSGLAGCGKSRLWKNGKNESRQDDPGAICCALMMILYLHFLWHFGKFRLFPQPARGLDPIESLDVAEVLSEVCPAEVRVH